MKIPSLATVVVFASSGAALPAAAGDFRYTHVDVAYTQIDADVPDDDGGGVRLGGSYALDTNVHLFGDYADYDLDGRTDREDLSMGAGLNLAWAPNTDLVGRLSYEDRDVSTPGRGPGDRDGYAISGGVRHHLEQRIEVNGGLVYYDLDDDEDIAARLGGLVGVTEKIALNGNLEVGDDTIINLGARVYLP